MSESKTYVDRLVRQSQGAYGAVAHAFQNNGAQVWKAVLVLHARKFVLAHGCLQFFMHSAWMCCRLASMSSSHPVV